MIYKSKNPLQHENYNGFFIDFNNKYYIPNSIWNVTLYPLWCCAFG